MERNFDIEPIQRADAETLDSWKNLARQVRDELAAAGIPVRGILMPEGDRDWVWEGASDNSDRSVGAGIAIDPEKFPDTVIDEASIWIDWQPHQELLDVVFELILKDAEKTKGHPAMVQFGKEVTDMRDAMLGILTAAGYQVVLSDDDLRPLELRVLSGPEHITV